MSRSFLNDFKPEDIPHPPASTIAIIKASTQTDVEVDALANAIAKNPAVSAEILRMVNSSLYRLSQDVDSIHHATVLLGVATVKNIALCLAVRESFKELESEFIDLDSYWQEAFLRATASQFWCEHLSDEAKDVEYLSKLFTLGLLADIGFLILFLMEPKKQNRWSLLKHSVPDQRFKMELDLFGVTHNVVGSELVKLWGLPEEFSVSIQQHHQDNIKDTTARYLKLADWSCALYSCSNKSESYQQLKSILAEKEQLNEEQINDLFSKMTTLADQVMQQMSIPRLKEFDIEDILHQANLKLADDNINYQTLNWRLQETLRERDVYAGKLQDELEIAREIQQSLQSDTSYREHVAALNIPAKVLSGDFFDYYEHDDGSITFCLGDVSGKGTHAALVMAKTISLFRCLTKVESNLQTVVELINQEMYETTTRGMFVTFVAGRLDLKSCGIDIINAGHIPPIKIGSKSAQQVEAHGPPLGVMAESIYLPETLPFTDDRLYLFTDGVTEAQMENGEELGSKTFLNWIIQSKNLPLKEQMDWLSDRFKKDIKHWQDDLTLMILASHC